MAKRRPGETAQQFAQRRRKAMATFYGMGDYDTGAAEKRDPYDGLATKLMRSQGGDQSDTRDYDDFESSGKTPRKERRRK